jgi:hypothetical protein
MSKNPQIIERKLGRHKSLGLCYEDGSVEIDERLKGEERLEVYVHELIHRHQPYLDEDEVDRLGKAIGADLWASGWRQVRG